MIKFFLFLIFSFSVHAQVVIGSKIFSEGMLISEMAAQIIEEKFDTPVTRKLGLGRTKVVFDALVAGDIDLYSEYTGTGYVMILKEEGLKESQQVYDRVSKKFKQDYQLIWSRPLGFNNTYALAIRTNDPRFDGITRISQLQGKLKDISYATPHEFMERKDGQKAFAEHYGLEFNPRKTKSMQAGLIYTAIKNETVDLMMTYSTDGRIRAFDLRLLEDDLNFFPPYEVGYLTSERSLKKFPFLPQVFALLESNISESEMIALNDQVDRLKIDVTQVARNFLISKGILKGVQTEQKPLNFISYLISKKTYLMQLLMEHILLSLGALLLALIISLPTGILLTRKEALGKIVFPTINTIQTIPSIALLGFMIPLLGIGYLPAMIALFLYSLLPLVRNTYAGIKGVPKDYKEASQGMGFTSNQILWHVEIPLALHIILAGLRTAAVIVIGTATLAAMVGAGGFGEPIFKGVATVNSQLILLGALPAALLAILVDKLLGLAEVKFVSKGLRLKR